MTRKLVILPFASVDLYLVKSKDSISVSHVVFELPFIAETIGVVKDSVSVFYVSFALAIVFKLGLAISHAEFIVAVAILKHFIQVFLVICLLTFYFAGCARSIVFAGFPLFISAFAHLCVLVYFRAVLS